MHFRKGDEKRHLSLKITLPPAWEANKTIREAVVEPFLKAYDKRYPDDTVCDVGPFEHLRVKYWPGPRPSAADKFRSEGRTPEVEEKMMRVELPTHHLLFVGEPASVLRGRSRGGHEVDVELLTAASSALVVRSLPSTALMQQGEALLLMLTDPEAELGEMHALVDAALQNGELAYEGVSTARDAQGRTALHLAVTRGDLTLCRKLMRREDDVLAIDSNRDSALTIACLAGRSLIVRELLDSGALIHEKNRDLMLPLNLACVDEAQGNGDVIRMLVESGGDVNAPCWDVTPLQAAANGGHYWAVETLLELGADVNMINGHCMGALDYARDMETANLIYDWMQGDKLPDLNLREKMESVRKKQAQHNVFQNSGLPGSEEKNPRIFQSTRSMPLQEAFAHLSISEEWLDPFRKEGAHYHSIRKAWRTLVLLHHPDKQGPTLTPTEQTECTARFASAMAAFEAIDEFYHTKGFASVEVHDRP